MRLTILEHVHGIRLLVREPKGEHWSFELKWKDHIAVIHSLAVKLVRNIPVYRTLSQTDIKSTIDDQLEKFSKENSRKQQNICVFYSAYRT